jgi:hypothetical protein
MSTTIFLILFSVVGHAEEPAYQVEVDPAVYPAAEFQGKGVKASHLRPRVKRDDALPDKTEREKAFAEVPGLAQDVAKMDELDRDMLFVRAKTRSLKELKNLYPGIAEKTLAALQSELKKSAAKK